MNTLIGNRTGQSQAINFILLISVIILPLSCAPQQHLIAELQPHMLKASNLEETITRRDEAMLAYSLTSYDARNKAVAVVSGGWGVASVKKNQPIDLRKQATPITLGLPKGGRVVASVVLIEVDDYAGAEQMLKKIQRIHNLVAVPAGILLTATEVLTPLNYVTAGLAAAGIGLQLADKVDEDDLLGQSSVTVQEADLAGKTGQIMHIPAHFTGHNLRDAFDYQLEYDLVVKTVKLKTANSAR